MSEYFQKDDGLRPSGIFLPQPNKAIENNETKVNNDKHSEKYCLYYNVFVHGCDSKECPFYPCKFAEFHKKIVKLFQTEFNTTCEESRRVARTLLLNSYRPNNKEKQ